MRWDYHSAYPSNFSSHSCLGRPVLFNFDPVARFAYDRPDSNHDDIPQLVSLCAIDAQILHILEMLKQRYALYVRHESLLVV